MKLLNIPERFFLCDQMKDEVGRACSINEKEQYLQNLTPKSSWEETTAETCQDGRLMQYKGS
jgi:hypothetical protein